MPPTFSIITCTRNSAATVAHTIASVNSQSDKDFEHIFVDGGSTDDTLDIIRQLSPTATILHNVTGGISRAMNAGLSVAQGNIVSHLHSDDFFADDQTLEVVAQAFEDDTVLWAVGDYELLVAGQRLRGAQVFPLSTQRLGIGNYIPHHSTFIRRSVFESAGGFSEELRLCMDYDLWFRLFQIRAPAHIPKVLAVFRAHQGSISTANRRATLIEELRVRFRYWDVATKSLPRYLYRFAKRWLRNRLV